MALQFGPLHRQNRSLYLSSDLHWLNTVFASERSEVALSSILLFFLKSIQARYDVK